jgi:16S rRNA U516 pseudouridylate synthase RsuA-like enzyme
LSEGLLIITNDGELARALELPINSLERVLKITNFNHLIQSYRVRVFGRMFNEEKLLRIR